MESVKRYHLGDMGLIDGESLGRLNVVLAADFDRVQAENLALQERLNTEDELANTNAYVMRENARLKESLNQRDEANHDLKQRRYAEQQAREAAERVAERYRWLRKTTPYRFKKMQDASVTDGGDVLYFHADRFDAAVDASIEAALNPTAVAEIAGSTCNQIREENNLPTNIPCVACNGGACIDR